MTVNNIAFPVVAVQNQNNDSTAFGKWFLRALCPETLSMKGLIDRVAWDQSVFSRDIIEGVVKRVTAVMVEQLQAGQPVKWEGLGTFNPQLDCGGNGANSVELLTKAADGAINGVHIRFTPENSKGEELTSRKFARLCSFEVKGKWIYKNITPGEGETFKPYRTRTLYPLDYNVENDAPMK
jgi:hypothetical protein